MINKTDTNELIRPHRWAEIIKAWADGETIQYNIIYCTIEPWLDYQHDRNSQDLGMFDDPTFIWRIKQEAKTGWIVIERSDYLSAPRVVQDYCSHIYATKELAMKSYECNMFAVIQITYTKGEGL